MRSFLENKPLAVRWLIKWRIGKNKKEFMTFPNLFSMHWDMLLSVPHRDTLSYKRVIEIFSFQQSE